MIMKMITTKYKDNKIGDEGVKMISEVLKSNSTLTELDLSGDEKRRIKVENDNEVTDKK